MSTAAVAGPSTAPLTSSGTQKQAVFEFTRRKRWADLLITELSDAIILILSPTAKVWFCGNAVSELLGWRDEELIDQDVTEFMNADDQVKFLTAFNDACRMRNELLCYCRLKCKHEFSQDTRDYSTSPKEVLFELKGYPHFVADDVECQCFFSVARPYPSRNTAMLNTFLELKIENERLQQRFNELQQRAAQKAGTQLTSEGYPGYSNPVPLAIPMSLNSPEGYYSRQAVAGPQYDGNNLQGGYEIGYRGLPNYGASNRGLDAALGDDNDDSARRKRLKKTHLGDQHVCVTCGRTDSPEWRKGPQGPKTLCNACGLRWAKQQRKFDADPVENGVDASQVPGTSSGMY
ncbi:hypothetical protein NEOLEDRAFT_1132163 [Neolentinus lepideus HHB14362 ss-1]|uniref:GATA-domain-containing protein n=1 Tax=Neolentinus lepideus HHB14362 ss-1 TaxID=1314782 RepID=A0A165TG80_9AGAM|nr:hypothetical protein NEOLEDRAFT_1132163 [Neolentinus lepideus HHB14362 ss-1]